MDNQLRLNAQTIVENKWYKQAANYNAIKKLLPKRKAPSKKDLEESSDIVFTRNYGSGYTIIGNYRDTSYELMVLNGEIDAIKIAGDKEEDIEEAEAWFKEITKKIQSEDENELVVDFTWRSGDSVRAESRKINAPKYEDVNKNYPGAVGDKTEAVANSDLSSGLNGRIMLFHGPPGTGKSYFIRSLGLEWQKKEDVSVTYVVDPENFLGKSADYLLDVLTSSRKGTSGSDMLNVIVLEDTGEMFQADAKENIGQGLSRLLNVADGILGQGLNCVFVLTTNEPVSQLHPALTRDGRCLANIEFQQFTRKEAESWLSDEGVRAEDYRLEQEKYTLAELYAIKRDSEVIESGSETEEADTTIYG